MPNYPICAEHDWDAESIPVVSPTGDFRFSIRFCVNQRCYAAIVYGSLADEIFDDEVPENPVFNESKLRSLIDRAARFSSETSGSTFDNSEEFLRHLSDEKHTQELDKLSAENTLLRGKCQAYQFAIRELAKR